MAIGASVERLRNYVGGRWTESNTTQIQAIRNPATGEVLAELPLGGTEDVDRAVRAAKSAYAGWRRVPVLDRSRYLMKLHGLLEENFEDLSRVVTLENGKTLPESRGSVRRGIECVEVAMGAPALLMGKTLEDIAPGIDCSSIRQPLGVFACISPFNFPAMVPMWFFPFAVASGNTFICKPSEQVPLSQKFIFDLVDRAGFPAGVLNLVHGGKEAAEALIAHPDVRGISFVGSSPVAAHVYKTAAAHGKRVQALGGAKNFLIVMPDAELESALDAIVGSAYACAGERCLAGSLVLAVGGTREKIREGLRRRLEGFVLGDGLDPRTMMGPVISAKHKERVLLAIDRGVEEGAKLIVDGRAHPATASTRGYFVGPSLFDGVESNMWIANEEIFGPVLGIIEAENLDRALDLVARHPLANASSIFTTSGRHARKFQYEIEASMTAINLGVAAPMSFFGFGGNKGSFFGDLKAHGTEAFDFYTDRKIVIARWS